jgi:hypothetical protein
LKIADLGGRPERTSLKLRNLGRRQKDCALIFWLAGRSLARIVSFASTADGLIILIILTAESWLEFEVLQAAAVKLYQLFESYRKY